MTPVSRRLLAALALSILFHALPFAADFWPRPAVPAPRPLLAELRPTPPPPPAPLPAPPPLILPDPPRPQPAAAPPKPHAEPLRPPAPARNWQEAVKRQIKQLDDAGLFYPEEAIARGQQGEALVLLILDEAGNAVAARLEQSSGHPLLDQAALRAARALRSLPADAPRETLIPIRFRLR